MFGPAPFLGTGLKLEFFDSVTSDASTIDVPATVIEDRDVLVLLDYATSSGATPADTTPTDFTQILTRTATIGLAGYRISLSARISDGTVAGSTLTGLSSNVNIQAKALAIFRANKALASVSGSDPEGEITSGNPAGSTIGASGGTPAVIALAGYGVVGADVDPRTFSPAKDGEINASNEVGATMDLWLAYKIMNRTSQLTDITADMDDEANANAFVSCFVELTAA